MDGTIMNFHTDNKITVNFKNIIFTSFLFVPLCQHDALVSEMSLNRILM